MGNYRPIADVWILARSKTKYYGAFPAGFLHRARHLLGAGPDDAVLHVCGGKVREYPFRGLGERDMTVDLDPATEPDYLMDVRKGIPIGPDGPGQWHSILIDRPYTEADAAKYVPGAEALPDLNKLLKDALLSVPPGHRVGVLDYLWPHPGKVGKEVAVVGVGTGRNARARWFTVFERIV